MVGAGANMPSLRARIVQVVPSSEQGGRGEGRGGWSAAINGSCGTRAADHTSKKLLTNKDVTVVLCAAPPPATTLFLFFFFYCKMTINAHTG